MSISVLQLFLVSTTKAEEDSNSGMEVIFARLRLPIINIRRRTITTSSTLLDTFLEPSHLLLIVPSKEELELETKRCMSRPS
jgi:hypothetical protein